MKWSLFLAALLAVADAGTVAPNSVRRVVAPEQVKLGEPFVYELILVHPPNQRYELKPPGELGAFELLGQERSRTDLPTEATTRFRLRFALFELGKKPLPALTFEVAERDQTSTWSDSPPSVEAVPTLPADAADEGVDLADIRGPEMVPVRTWAPLYWAAGGVAALVLGALLFRWWKARRDRPASAPLAPPLPLPQRTLAALEALRKEDLPGQGREQEYFFRLSEIVRTYLGERYGFEALESTSTELLDTLRRLHTEGLPMDELRGFVHTSDLAKFAKTSVGPDACKSAMEFAHRLVQQTAVALMAPPPPVSPRANAR